MAKKRNQQKFNKTKKFTQDSEPQLKKLPLSQPASLRQLKVLLKAASRRSQDAESLGFASLVVSNINLLPRLKKLPMNYRLANQLLLNN
ncbi:MAG: hypothetical protein ACLSGX_10090 [Pseudoruminococcus massiliensis]|uniref:hypothetical protein n=1 Tax=Pseudoruminococcus massiliensis TaxID=2086583 RepID=UPI003995BCC9|nr:hypothetical protein [Oscillospiraceae bacterium]